MINAITAYERYVLSEIICPSNDVYMCKDIFSFVEWISLLQYEFPINVMKWIRVEILCTVVWILLWLISCVVILLTFTLAVVNMYAHPFNNIYLFSGIFCRRIDDQISIIGTLSWPFSKSTKLKCVSMFFPLLLFWSMCVRFTLFVV